jgi:hypothetical protein
MDFVPVFLSCIVCAALILVAYHVRRRWLGYGLFLTVLAVVFAIPYLPSLSF